jgi:hypothetical protein
MEAVLYLRRLVAGFPSRRPRFEPRSGRMWWTNWHWGRFSPSTSVSPANSRSTDSSTPSSHIIRGSCQTSPEVPYFGFFMKFWEVNLVLKTILIATHFTIFKILWLFSVGVLEGWSVSEKSVQNSWIANWNPNRYWSHFYRNSNQSSEQFSSSFAWISWSSRSPHGTYSSVTDKVPKYVQRPLKVSYSCIQYQRSSTYFKLLDDERNTLYLSERSIYRITAVEKNETYTLFQCTVTCMSDYRRG